MVTIRPGHRAARHRAARHRVAKYRAAKYRAAGLRAAGFGLAGAGVLALTACGLTGGSGSSTSSAATASTAATGPPAASKPLGGKLTGLRAGAKVTRLQSVSGVVDGLPSKDAAWLVVYTVSAPAYWPQKGPLKVDVAGDFKSTAVFGSAAAGNVGQHFIVRLVITAKSATARFRAFLADPSQGLSKLPSGVRTLTRVTVTRS